MALHEVNLWNVSSRPNSSLDVTSPYGGLVSGRIDLPASSRTAKGFKVRVSGSHTIEDYATIQALVTGLGGSVVTNLSGKDVVIEFNTSGSTNGSRGIFAIEGIFVRDWHPDAALTKGVAESVITPLGVDEYKWEGSQAVNNGDTLNLISLKNFSNEVATGDTTISANAMVVLPVAAKPRGLLISVIMDGNYQSVGPHELRVKLTSADGTTVQQSAPLTVVENQLGMTVVTMATYTNGVHDELSTTGFKLIFCNDSTSNLTLSSVRIVIQSISNPDFTRGY